MATVKVKSGPVSAMDSPIDVPVERWRHLVLERRDYLSVQLPHDCRSLLRFVNEAEQYEMWKHIEHIDRTTGETRKYVDHRDFIRNAFNLDDEKVEWAKKGLKEFDPNEPVPFDDAVDAGKKAKVIEIINEHPDWNDKRVADAAGCSRSWVQEVRAGLVPVYVEPKLLKNGEKKADSCYHGNTLSERGNSKDYVVARLDRDGKTDLAEQVRSGAKSARQASIEAGFKVPESQLTILKRAWRKASEAERQSFKIFIEVN